MAHVRQELALGQIGAFGLDFGCVQRGVEPLQRCLFFVEPFLAPSQLKRRQDQGQCQQTDQDRDQPVLVLHDGNLRFDLRGNLPVDGK
jgi:hypothetical protein